MKERSPRDPVEPDGIPGALSKAPNCRVVWILNHYAQIPSGPGGTRHYWLARHLRSHGWQAIVVAASTELDKGRMQLRRERGFALEEINGVPFVWLQVPAYRGNGLGRLRNMVAFALRACSTCAFAELPAPDVVIGSSVHPFAGVAAERLARRHHVPFVFEVRDLWPETLIAFGRIKRNSLVAGAMRAIERYLCQRAASVITVLPNAWEYFCSSVGMVRDDVVWIPNGVELSGREVVPLARERGGKFCFMYLGAHGQANDLWTLLAAVAQLEKTVGPERFEVRLIGDGLQKESLVEYARQMGLSSVRFEAPIPSVDVHTVAEQADAFVLTALNRPELYRYGVSMNKIFDYMAAARPVVVAMSAGNNPVLEAQAGFVVEPEDPAALAECLYTAMNTPAAELREMGLRGRASVERHYDYAVLAGRLADVLSQAVIHG